MTSNRMNWNPFFKKGEADHAILLWRYDAIKNIR